MAEVKWIKIVTDIFDNRKIRQIERMPEADAIIVIWFKLLCLAGNINESGLIMFTSDIPYTDEMLAHEFNRPINTVRMALQTYVRFGMIEIVDSVYRVSNWERYQNIEGMDRIREQTRLRNIKYRNRKRLAATNNKPCDVTYDATVTSCDATDKEEDIERDIERDIEKEIHKEKEKPAADAAGGAGPEKPKKRAKKSDSDLDLSFILDDSVRASFTEFIEHRKQIKKPMTQLAVEKAYKGLLRMYQDTGLQIAAIDNAIAKGWQGIYPLDNIKPMGGAPNGKQPDLGKFRTDTALPY